VLTQTGELLVGSRQLALLHEFVQLPDELSLSGAVLIVYERSRRVAFQAFIRTASSIDDANDFIAAIDLQDVIRGGLR
jgi:hypothetical protein